MYILYAALWSERPLHFAGNNEIEGTVKGQIIEEKRGEAGFGYDPIFQPEGYELTFAELGHDVKNKISHRARAVSALCDYLSKEQIQ